MRYFQEEREKGRRDWQALLLARDKVTETDFLFFHPSLNNPTRRQPSFKRNLRDCTRVLNVLCEVMHRKSQEKDLEEFVLALTILESIQAEHYFRGKGTSSLAGLVFMDLKKLYRIITCNGRLSKLLKETLAMADWSARVPKGRERV